MAAMFFKKTPKPDDYHVGWVCAIQCEFVVACELLDEEFGRPQLSGRDPNHYRFGRMGKHNVVITCLPQGRYGTDSAASVAGHMTRSFHQLHVRLMVGVGGGVPSGKNDIRLGDVVVSTPSRSNTGVIQYDSGTHNNAGFEMIGWLNSPFSHLVQASHHLAAQHIRQGHRFRQTVEGMIAKNKSLRRDFGFPGAENDVLFASSFVHPGGSSSGQCKSSCFNNTANIVRRPQRDRKNNSPVVHYGLIASGNQLVKNAKFRDELAQSTDILCFEMEAAGLMYEFRPLIITGIADYSDTHKNDMWQGYAAATAAAYAKELLEILPSR